MAKWNIQDMLTNIEISGGALQATSATSSEYFQIGDFITNAKLGAGSKLPIAPDGSHDRFLTIEDSVTNISLDSQGRFNVNDHLSEIDHKAEWGILGNSNMDLDASGRIIVNTTGATPTINLSIGGAISNVYIGDGGGIDVSGTAAPILNNLLLETGDDLLLETGDKILLEA